MKLGAVLLKRSPIGVLAIGVTEHGVAEMTILNPGQRRAEFSHDPKSAQLVVAAANQLEEYFAGNRERFDLPFDLAGTEFQKSVWLEIAKINKGETQSYGELAARIQKPMAARAVGGAVGANPIPIVIGCHRILGSSGTLTGYSGGGGLETKRWLLDFEGVRYKS